MYEERISFRGKLGGGGTIGSNMADRADEIHPAFPYPALCFGAGADL